MLSYLKYPVIQAPMAGNIVTPELVAKVSNAGMLGSVASGYMAPAILEEYLVKVKSLTAAPFLLNIFIEEPRYQDIQYRKPELIISYEEQIGLEREEFFTVPKTVSEEDYLEIILKHGISVVSTTFGFFQPSTIRKLHQHKVAIIATVTSAAEAILALDAGVEALVIQGTEAGGHQGSFLANEINLVDTVSLFQQLKQYKPEVPLIIAGGINLANIKKYWATGADMLQLGTVFMLSDLSALGRQLQAYIINQVPLVTDLSSHLTGKWVRGLTNRLFIELAIHDYPFPIQHYATSRLRSEARKRGYYDFSGIWLGKHDEYRLLKTDELLATLQEQYFDYKDKL